MARVVASKLDPIARKRPRFQALTAIIMIQRCFQLEPRLYSVCSEMCGAIHNGKGVAIDGTPLPYECGEIDFGEPGTNGKGRWRWRWRRGGVQQVLSTHQVDPPSPPRVCVC